MLKCEPLIYLPTFRAVNFSSLPKNAFLFLGGTLKNDLQNLQISLRLEITM